MDLISAAGQCDEQKISHRQWCPASHSNNETGTLKKKKQFICNIATILVFLHLDTRHHYWFRSSFVKLLITGDSIINKHESLFAGSSCTDPRLSCSHNSQKTRWDNSRTLSPHRLERNCYRCYGYADSGWSWWMWDVGFSSPSARCCSSRAVTALRSPTVFRAKAKRAFTRDP